MQTDFQSKINDKQKHYLTQQDKMHSLACHHWQQTMHCIRHHENEALGSITLYEQRQSGQTLLQFNGLQLANMLTAT